MTVVCSFMCPRLPAINGNTKNCQNINDNKDDRMQKRKRKTNHSHHRNMINMLTLDYKRKRECKNKKIRRIRSDVSEA